MAFGFTQYRASQFYLRKKEKKKGRQGGRERETGRETGWKEGKTGGGRKGEGERKRADRSSRECSPINDIPAPPSGPRR